MKVRKSFLDIEIQKISELFEKHDYEVDYNPVAAFGVEKTNSKYCEIRPIEFGHWGFEILIKPIKKQLPYDESVEMLNELSQDVSLLKDLMEIWNNSDDFFIR